MYLIIDNYDSFTYNLFQYLVDVSGKQVEVIRNDRINISEIQKINPEAIILSPGPGRPEEAGICVECIKYFSNKVPILGICLGHQSIGHAFGASIIHAQNIVHGKTEEITLDGRGLFRNLPPRSRFTRYHSLVIDKKRVPSQLEVTATSDDGEIMGVRHRKYPVEGIQFHPESIASEYGKKILKNFIYYKREPFDIKGCLSKVLSGSDLSETEAAAFMDELTTGELTHAQISAVLIALNSKLITSQELAGFASVLNTRKVKINYSKPLLDTCGTGGDETGSFNISSLSAIVASSCGVPVAKHGNRSVSSKSGSADFYQEIGIPSNLPAQKAALLLEKTGFTFLFAPIYHGSMKHAAQVRRELGIKTVMNLLGPLVNPADAQHQLIGVFSDKYCLPMAEAAKQLGKSRVMIVRSVDGFDEIAVSAPTRIVEINENDQIKDYRFDPVDLGIKYFERRELIGGTPKQNALIAEELLSSGGRPAIREAVLLNAGAALYVYSHAKNIRDGYLVAKDALETGKVKNKLAQIREEGKRLLSNGNGEQE